MGNGRRVRLSEAAQVDLEDIWVYNAQDNVRAADRFLDRIHEMCSRLAESPRMGRKRDELSRDIRSFAVGTYVIFYRPGEHGIDVARILSGYRDIEDILEP